MGRIGWLDWVCVLEVEPQNLPDLLNVSGERTGKSPGCLSVPSPLSSFLPCVVNGSQDLLHFR